MTLIASATGNQTPASVIAGAPDWRSAVTDLVAWLITNDRCFSSGEVAAYLRTYRPDLKFSAAGIGDYIRDQYDSGAIPSYTDGAGNTMYPVQVPRTSNGIGRTLDGRTVVAKTPVGTTVFVYAKDGADGFAHDFEVFIPDFDDPQATRAVDASQGQVAAAAAVPVVTQPTANTPAPAAQPTPTPVPGTAPSNVILGALNQNDFIAEVRSDRRLCVERRAFQAFVAITGAPLRGGPHGDPVYIAFNLIKQSNGTDKPVALITRDQAPNAKPHHLWNNAGRVAFGSNGNSIGFAPFNPKDKYKVEILPATATEPAMIVIDLSATI